MAHSQEYQIEPLASHHDRAAFSCGEISLDAYLQKQASQDVKRDLAACYVLCHKGSSEIIGYYTLSASTVDLIELPTELAKKSGRYRLVSAVLLGRLAVDARYQGQRMSTILLLNALRRALRTGVGIKVVVVDALHDKAATFYEHYEFRRFAQQPLRLYLPLSKVRDIFPGEGQQAAEIIE